MESAGPWRRPRYTRIAELPLGTLNGPQFSAVLTFLVESGEFELLAERKIDWARHQQEWQHRATGAVYVLDYPFERGRGSLVRREDHPSVHLFEQGSE